MMFNNKQEFFEAIERDLGGSLVEVELTQEDYERAFQKAKKIFQQRGNDNYQKQFVKFDVEPDKYEYQLPDEINVDYVVRLIQTRGGTLYTNDPMHLSALYSFLSFQRAGTQFDLLSYQLSQMIHENIDHFFAKDIPFHFHQFNNTIKLFGSPESKETWFMECFLHSLDTEYIQMRWISEWTRAEAKEMIGMAYRKFGEIRTPLGKTQLPGSDLIKEAKEEKNKLLEEIQNFTDGMPTGYFVHMG